MQPLTVAQDSRGHPVSANSCLVAADFVLAFRLLAASVQATEFVGVSYVRFSADKPWFGRWCVDDDTALLTAIPVAGNAAGDAAVPSMTMQMIDSTRPFFGMIAAADTMLIVECWRGITGA